METMAESRILKAAMKERDITQVVLAERMGTSQTALSANVNRMRMSVEVFKEYLDAMEYDVVVIDRRSGEPVWKLDA